MNLSARTVYAFLSTKMFVIALFTLALHLHHRSIMYFPDLRNTIGWQLFLLVVGAAGLINCRYKSYKVSIAVSIAILLISNFLIIGLYLKDNQSADWAGRITDVFFIAYTLTHLFRYKRLDDRILC